MNDPLNKTTGLSQSKQALLELMLEGKEPEGYPLSFSQQRLWLLDQLEPGLAVYNMNRVWRLKGEIHFPALDQAFKEVVRRHEILRTTFKAEAGQPVQIIHPKPELKVRLVDLQGLLEAEKQDLIQRLRKQLFQRPFNLSTGPLIRVILLRLSKTESRLLTSMHHIVADGWSTNILRSESGSLYQCFGRGAPSRLAELLIQYADFAAWQRQQADSQAYRRQLDYWRQQLAGADGHLALPGERRPGASAAISHGGGRQRLGLGGALSQRLRHLSRQHGVTPYMSLLAGLVILLARYSGQAEIVVGTAVAGRSRRELEGLIGFFVNTLVLRVGVGREASYKAVLERVREVALGGYANQEVAFERVVEELRPERALHQTPLFRLMFAFQNAGSSSKAQPADEAVSAELVSGSAKFDLSIVGTQTTEELVIEIAYKTDLFEAATIGRMLGHYRMLLEAIVTEPDRAIGELAMLTEAEERQLLEEWNPSTMAAAPEQLVTELFAEQAVVSPDRVAVVCGDQQLSYGALARRANQLARYLRRQAIGPEQLVGICLERGLEMVVALLGVLKAGAAYVPLDPAYPQQRLHFMAGDAHLALLLTAGEVANKLAGLEVRQLRLDADWQEVARASRAGQSVEGFADNLAYVIYTSGSTGQPKGVQVTHGGLANLVNWHQQAYGVTASDRATVLAAIGFDASVWEVWPYLTAGATLIIVDDENRAAADQLNAWLTRHAITISFLPTPLAELALRQHWPDGCTLRYLLTGGDRLQQRPERSQRFQLVNHYGPTENSVVSTCEEVEAWDQQMRPPAIGRPIANTKTYVTDGQQRLLPVEVAGELCLGGRGLARGYVNGAALTAERFIPDAYSRQGGQRCYRTGDMVQQLADGRLEFCGRIDQQVKIRGYRIELGEIEAALNQHAGVAESVVMAEEYAGQKRLVAYLVGTATEKPTAKELQTYLGERLPDYMVPRKYVDVPALPLTANGKIDRQQLSALGRREPELAEAEEDGSENLIEEMVSGVWGELLGIKRVGRHDNFFDLGGHSLLATQVISRLREVFKIDLAVKSLFESPTVAKLAKVIETSLRDGHEPSESVIKPAAPEQRQAASFAQQKQWLLEQMALGQTDYNIEEILAWMWGELLGVKRVGRDDNFFDLGGHSLLATRVISRVREVFKVDLAVKDLFESPTVAKLAKAIEACLRDGQELDESAIEPVPPGQGRAASFAQQRLWFLEQMTPGQTVYNIPTVMHLQGELNLAAIEASINEVIRRHEALRTSFAVEDGEPVQVIHPHVRLSLPVVDLSGLQGDEGATQARRLRREEQRRVFDLRLGPLVRVRLLRLNQQAHVLLTSMHHIVADGWSTNILRSESGSLYQCFGRGAPSRLAELLIQYADFAAWQRQQADSHAYRRQLDYWRQQLAGADGHLALPGERRPGASAAISHGGGRQRLGLGGALSQRLRHLSRQHGVTPYMSLLAGLVVLLARYSGQAEIVVGTAVAGRSRRELEGLIGFFVNTLVLRVGVGREASYKAVLERVREVALGGYANQEVAFERVVEELRPERALHQTPLFRLMFAFQNSPRETLQMSGLTWSSFEGDEGAAKFDLSLVISDNDEDMVATLIYNKELFETAKMARMLEHFRIILEAAVAHPDDRIGSLSFLTCEEQRRLHEWSRTGIDYSQDITVHELFEQQVTRTPEKVAAVGDRTALTFQHLNQQANRLASLITGLRR